MGICIPKRLPRITYLVEAVPAVGMFILVMLIVNGLQCKKEVPWLTKEVSWRMPARSACESRICVVSVVSLAVCPQKRQDPSVSEAGLR